MNDPSARGNKMHSADLGTPRVAPAPFRPAAQRTQERRRALILGCGILLVDSVSLGVNRDQVSDTDLGSIAAIAANRD
jgi:hypothetical protein